MAWYAEVDGDGRLQSEPVDYRWPGWQEVPGPLPDDGWWDTAEWRVEDGRLVHDPDERQEANAALMERSEEYDANAYVISCETDAALCETYEALLDAQAVMAEQDAAICELYEMAIGAA